MSWLFSPTRSKRRGAVSIAVILLDALGLAHQLGAVSEALLVASLGIAAFTLGREVGL